MTLGLINGFYILENSSHTIFSNDLIKIEVTEITKDFPPSQILLKYQNCSVKYVINNDNKINYGFFYNDNKYLPEDLKLLRYSSNGIVTMDFIPCRVTLFGNDYFKPYFFSIENKSYFFDRELFDLNLEKFSKVKNSHYSFNFNWECFCTEEFTKVTKIEVENNTITNFNNKDYYTLFNLFSYVDNLIFNNNTANKIDIKYNKNYGFIEEFYIDKDMNIADEEIGFL